MKRQPRLTTREQHLEDPELWLKMIDPVDREQTSLPIVPCCSPAPEPQPPLYAVGSRFAAIIGYW